MSPSPQDTVETIPYNEIAGAAYRLATDGAVTRPRPWQVELYRRLSDSGSEAGFLLIAPPGSGKLDSVIIPSLGIKRGGAPRRIFLIAAGGSPLDDFVYRYAPRLRNWASADGVSRTMYVAGDDNEAGSRYYSDGRETADLAVNPLEADVDLVLVTLDRFQDLFFGAGGVHALPSALATPDTPSPRRDLFLFDEAHEYTEEGFARFQKLLEFLFAEDFDVIVSTSTMPVAWQEELSFLETIHVPSNEEFAEPQRSFSFRPDENLQAVFQALTKEHDLAGQRIIAVAETVAEASALAASVSSDLEPIVYHEALAQEDRREIYASLREGENRNEGYVLVTTACALEGSDLDAAVLVTGFCPPESLLRRAGRLNRRGKYPTSRLIVAGTDTPKGSRALPEAKAADYRKALQEADRRDFNAAQWLPFI